MDTKTCSKCGCTKNINYFGKRKEAKDGRMGVCKVCRNIRTNKYRAVGGDVEKIARAKKQAELAKKGYKNCSWCNLDKPVTDFYTGKDGRIASQCLSCSKHNKRKRYVANRVSILQNKKEYYVDNAEEIKDKRKEYYFGNKEKVIAGNLAWRKNNRDSQKKRGAKRYYDTKKATPPWLTETQLLEIAIMYSKCRELTDKTGIMHHVDHIIPIGHPAVSGLHVPWNLQILTASDNCSKGTTFNPKQGVAHTCQY